MAVTIDETVLMHATSDIQWRAFIHTHTHTDIYTDRQTDRPTDRQTHARETNIHTHTHAHTQEQGKVTSRRKRVKRKEGIVELAENQL